MQGSCQGPCNGVTSSESIIRHSSAVRRERRGQISDVRDGGFARSARTRRPVTRGRLNVRRIQNGIVGIGNLFQYRVESVRHDISPSCRDCSRQGPACPETTAMKSPMPCPSALFVRSASPITRVGVAARCLSGAPGASEIKKIPLGDIQAKSYRSHIAVGFEPTIAC